VRNVKRAWVTDSDDVSRLFLFTFSEKSQEDYIFEPDRNPLFVAQVDRPRTKAQIMRRERSSTFKFEVLKKYENKCVLSNLSVIEMLDGAHVIPVEKGGSDDVRNGLLLSASIHRAFDAKLWAINPDTLRIETRERGPSLEKMKITVDSLAGLKFLPHIDAIVHRYKIFKEAS
jgi:putative restriction endonuclease